MSDSTKPEFQFAPDDIVIIRTPTRDTILHIHDLRVSSRGYVQALASRWAQSTMVFCGAVWVDAGFFKEAERLKGMDEP